MATRNQNSKSKSKLRDGRDSKTYFCAGRDGTRTQIKKNKRAGHVPSLYIPGLVVFLAAKICQKSGKRNDLQVKIPDYLFKGIYALYRNKFCVNCDLYLYHL